MLDYAADAQVRNQNLANSLVNGGLISKDQASSFLQGADINAISSYQGESTIGHLIPKSKKRNYIDEIKQSTQYNEAVQAHTTPPPAPTFAETLQYLAQSEDAGGAEKTNYTQALETLVNDPNKPNTPNTCLLYTSPSPRDS